jgi:hypothetical protein
MVLRMAVPLFSKSLCPHGRGEQKDLCFLGTESSHSTQEVNDWRCHRRETDPNI